MRIIEYTISKHYLPALINGDYTGLDELDKHEFSGWLRSVQDFAAHWAVDWEELDNTRYARCEVSGLYSDCSTIKHVFR
jgi:hypothetical protein